MRGDRQAGVLESSDDSSGLGIFTRYGCLEKIELRQWPALLVQVDEAGKGLVYRREGEGKRIGEYELCLVGAVPAQLGEV